MEWLKSRLKKQVIFVRDVTLRKWCFTDVSVPIKSTGKSPVPIASRDGPGSLNSMFGHYVKLAPKPSAVQGA